MPFQKGHGRLRTEESYKKAAIKIGLHPNSTRTRFKKGSSGFTGKHTEETKKKIREARARQGSNVWNKGLSGYKTKPCSEERKRKIGDAQRKKKNHNWRGGKPRCVICDKQLTHYNSSRCRGCGMKTTRGTAHWNWSGGLSREPYPYYFRESLKREIRKRDNYTCACCGKWGNSIHHIDYNKNNCLESNLITLCKSCNTKANYHRNKWTKFYKNKLCHIPKILFST